MSKRHLMTGSSAIAVLFAFLATSAAFGSNRQGGVTIKATDKGETYVINKSATDRMYFTPGTISVKSGSTLTFTYEGKPTSEPHTISVVAQKDLPGDGLADQRMRERRQQGLQRDHRRSDPQPEGASRAVERHRSLDRRQGQPRARRRRRQHRDRRCEAQLDLDQGDGARRYQALVLLCRASVDARDDQRHLAG